MDIASIPRTRPARMDSIGKPGTPWPAVGLVKKVKSVDCITTVDVMFE